MVVGGECARIIKEVKLLGGGVWARMGEIVQMKADAYLGREGDEDLEVDFFFTQSWQTPRKG